MHKYSYFSKKVHSIVWSIDISLFNCIRIQIFCFFGCFSRI